MRFKAPEHASDVSISSGIYLVKNGYVTVPDDTGPGDLGGLNANGFVRDEPAGEPAKQGKAGTEDKPAP